MAIVAEVFIERLYQLRLDRADGVERKLTFGLAVEYGGKKKKRKAEES